MKLIKLHKLLLLVTGLITAYGLYIGVADDNWGQIPYALIFLTAGLVLVKKNGTQRQAQSATKSLKVFIVLGILAAATSIAYLIWMSGFTF